MKKIIFTIKETGHNLEYLHHIYEECLMLNDVDYVFLVPEKIKSLFHNFNWERNDRIVFDFIPSDVQNQCLSHNLLINSFFISKLLRKKVKEHNADELFAITIMSLMPFAGFMIPTRISGIIYGIYLYNWKSMSFQRKLFNVFKYYLFCKNGLFKNILLLNDKASAKYLNRIYKTTKFQYLPDPYLKIKTDNVFDFREKYNIDRTANVFLHFGAIERRKGTLDILKSIEILPDDIKERSFFVIAGKIKDDIREEVYERIRIINTPRLLVLDEFCSYDTLASMCLSCNAILMPYLEIDKSSGLLGYASQFSKPVIGSSYGLIGKLIRRYRLGYTCTPGCPEEMIMNYKNVINSTIDNPSDAYCRDNSVSHFKMVIGNVTLQMNKELVSCIIPTYKRCNTLERAIYSALHQSYTNLEVLVVDDNEKGSSQSVEIAKLINNIADSRVRLVTQDEHINGAKARNEGILKAQGEYVAFLDDDDEWLPDKIEKQVDYLKNNGHLSGCSVLYNEYKKGVLVHSCPVYTEDNIFQKIFRREVAVFTSTVLLKRDCLIKSGMFDISLRRHQDLQMLLRFTKEFKLGVLPEYLVKLHLDSTINRPDADSIVKVKEDFFRSVKDLYDGCNKKDRSLIKSAHCYEVMFAALKQKKLLMCINYFLKAGFNIEGYRLLRKRIRDRKFIAK